MQQLKNKYINKHKGNFQLRIKAGYNNETTSVWAAAVHVVLVLVLAVVVVLLAGN